MSTPPPEPISSWSAGARRRIEAALVAALTPPPPTEVARAARYVALDGAHRWRGLLAVAAGLAYDPQAEAYAVPLAAAVEMMHAASLVLDDLPSMDNAATRRGKACVHLVFPEWAVDMLPPYLVHRAYHVVAGIEAAPAERRLRALRMLGDMGSALVRGQELDLTSPAAPVAESALLEGYALKSGSLFAGALAAGALLCGAEEGEADALREAGIRLGQAFQILDDIADGPEEDSDYKEAGRFTAYSLWGPDAARRRALDLLADARRIFDRLGPRADRIRDVLAEIQAPVAG